MRYFVKIGWMVIATLGLAVLGGLAGHTAALPGHALNDPAAISVQSPAPNLRPLSAGNYCVGCHTAADARLAAATEWRGGIERAAVSPCPAAKTIQEELYYTERLMLAIAKARNEIPDSAQAAKVDTKFAATVQGYNRLLDAPVTSLEGFRSEAQTLRYQLGKVYTQLNDLDAAAKQQRLLIWGGIVTLIVLASLVWGLRHTIKFTGQGRSRLWPAWNAKTLLPVIAIFALFALPIFRTPAAEQVTSSAEQQAVQNTLDAANRYAETAERWQGRAWMLARVGAMQAVAGDAIGAEQALQEALAAVKEAQASADTLWGEANAAREAAGVTGIDLEKASLASKDLKAAQGRTWGNRLVAVEWASVDPTRSIELLEEAAQAAEWAADPYRDLDLRAISVSLAGLDPAMAVKLAGQVSDRALRAWALREIAWISGDKAIYLQAVEAARQVSDPVQRSHALRELAALGSNAALYDEALATLEGVQGSQLAYSLADLAAASGRREIAGQVDAAYPDALAYALLKTGDYDAARKAAGQIEDEMERAHALAAIAVVEGTAAAADGVAHPILRDRARLEIIRKTGDASLVESISSGYYQVMALVALGRYEEAYLAAGNLREGYPLVRLGAAWAESNSQAALAIVDLLKRETDKAAVLAAVAGQDPAQFERALGMALAARVRGDSLAPAEASLALARAVWDTPEQRAAAMAQAYEAALRISIK